MLLKLWRIVACLAFMYLMLYIFGAIFFHTQVFVFNCAVVGSKNLCVAVIDS